MVESQGSPWELVIAVLARAIKNHDIAIFGLGIAFCGFGEQTLTSYYRFTGQWDSRLSELELS